MAVVFCNFRKKQYMRVLITGATGLIGQAIVKQCHKKDIAVHYLTTSKDKLSTDETYKGFYWNPSKGEIDTSCFEGTEIPARVGSFSAKSFRRN